MKTAKKAQAKKSERPTYAELVEQRHNLKRKVWLLRQVLAGEAADLEFAEACGITGSESTEQRRIKGGALRRAGYGLDYILQGEG